MNRVRVDKQTILSQTAVQKKEAAEEKFINQYPLHCVCIEIEKFILRSFFCFTQLSLSRVHLVSSMVKSL
jgi:hypothetical protein